MLNRHTQRRAFQESIKVSLARNGLTHCGEPDSADLRTSASMLMFLSISPIQTPCFIFIAWVLNSSCFWKIEFGAPPYKSPYTFFRSMSIDVSPSPPLPYSARIMSGRGRLPATKAHALINRGSAPVLANDVVKNRRSRRIE